MANNKNSKPLQPGQFTPEEEKYIQSKVNEMLEKDRQKLIDAEIEARYNQKKNECLVI